MEKKLTTKTQRLNPILDKNSTGYSRSIIVEPDDLLEKEKKGIIYVVFDLSAPKEIDHTLIEKVIHDILHNSYFQSENASPIQSIEKAIITLRDSITNIITDNGENPVDITFNIGSCILWGKTVYVVQYGNIKTCLMRDGEMRPISAASEGNFAVASGAVKDGDVILCATDGFVAEYPPEQVSTITTISEDVLKPMQSALIMKFDILKSFSEAEQLQINSPTMHPDLEFDPGAQNASKRDSRHDRNKKSVRSIGEESIVDEMEGTEESDTTRDRRNRKLRRKRGGPNALGATITSLFKKKPVILALIFLAVLLVGILAYSVFMSGNPNNSSDGTERSPELLENDVIGATDSAEGQNVEDINVDSPESDTENKVLRITPEIFYDLLIESPDVQPSQVIVAGNTLVVLDLENQAFYYSSLDVPKFTKLPSAVEVKQMLRSKEGSIGIMTQNQYQKLEPQSGTEFASFNLEQNFEPQITRAYLEFLYSKVDNQIFRLQSEGSLLKSGLWAQDTRFSDVTDFEVNISIYLLNNHNEILKYTSGKAAAFSLQGPQNELGYVTDIYTNQELEYIYIADQGNRRILVIDSDGNIVRQIKSTRPDNWSEITGIAVNDQENTLFVMEKTRIYEIPLTNTTN